MVAMLFQVRTRDPIPGVGDGKAVVDYVGHPSRYLTDGVNPYRLVGEIGPLIALRGLLDAGGGAVGDRRPGDATSAGPWYRRVLKRRSDRLPCLRISA
jgi:hypothetical protein